MNTLTEITLWAAISVVICGPPAFIYWMVSEFRKQERHDAVMRRLSE